jgi:hypothetical protein
VSRKASDFFPFDIAIENLREEERAIFVLTQNLRDRTAHGAEADESDFQLLTGLPGGFW